MQEEAEQGHKLVGGKLQPGDAWTEAVPEASAFTAARVLGGVSSPSRAGESCCYSQALASQRGGLQQDGRRAAWVASVCQAGLGTPGAAAK